MAKIKTVEPIVTKEGLRYKYNIELTQKESPLFENKKEPRQKLYIRTINCFDDPTWSFDRIKDVDIYVNNERRRTHDLSKDDLAIDRIFKNYNVKEDMAQFFGKDKSERFPNDEYFLPANLDLLCRKVIERKKKAMFG